MARLTAEAIILRSRPVGESDLIVTFLTEQDGKRDGAARSARKSRRRFAGGLEPLSRGRAAWTESEGRELVRLEAFEVSASFSDVQADLAWFYVFAYLAEVSDTFARDRQPDPDMYRLLRAATDAARAGVAPVLVRPWFETWMLRLQGLLPDLDTCSRCGAKPGTGGAAVALGTGEMFCAACERRDGSAALARLTEEDLAWARAALRKPATRLPLAAPTVRLDRLLGELLVRFTGRPFRSARFLESVR